MQGGEGVAERAKTKAILKRCSFTPLLRQVAQRGSLDRNLTMFD